jgi:hypothetical protein
MKKISLIGPALLMAIGLALSGYFIANGINNFKQFDRYVVVKGLAERTVEANQAIWELKFNYTSNDLTGLYQGVSQAQQQIKAFLMKEGFAANNLRMEPVTVVDNDSLNYRVNQNTKRYSATSGISLVTPKVALVGDAIQKSNAIVQSGVILQESTVKYLFTKLNDIKPEMLNQATANAKEAATTFARNAKNKLKGIRHASQGLFSISNADGTYGQGDPDKKVRVVTTVQYFLK